LERAEHWREGSVCCPALCLRGIIWENY